MNIRIATRDDLKTIVRLRMEMLEELAEDLPEGLAAAIRYYLDLHLRDGTCMCAVMENKTEVVAKAMLCVYEVMPDEGNPSGKCASLFSVYTLPEYRGHGYMGTLLAYFLDKAKDAGVGVVLASAEERAIPLYERMGFARENNNMCICL